MVLSTRRDNAESFYFINEPYDILIVLSRGEIEKLVKEQEDSPGRPPPVGDKRPDVMRFVGPWPAMYPPAYCLSGENYQLAFGFKQAGKSENYFMSNNRHLRDLAGEGKLFRLNLDIMDTDDLEIIFAQANQDVTAQESQFISKSVSYKIM